MGNEKKYWRGIGQLADEQAHTRAQENEFPEHIPVDQFIGDDKAMEKSGTNRRDFLKFLGFSAAAATLAACEAPVMNAIPYVVRPEEIVPGVANWYATSYFDGYDYCSILVKTREGRPVKIEGNPMSKITRGAVDGRTHASVLSLYDSNRARGPMQRSGSTWTNKTWEDADKAAAAALQGKSIAIISSTIISPSTMEVIAKFKAAHPNTKHLVYDAVSFSGIAKAHAGAFGQAVVPTYNLDKAEVVISLACDFLNNWVSPLEHARQYADARRVSTSKTTMLKHFQFEAILSLTGANADERFPVKPSLIGKIAMEMLDGNGSTPGVKQALDAARGRKALVVCGSNDPAIQRVVCEINKNLGAYNNGLIDISTPDLTHQGDDEAFANFVKNELSGMGAVIFYNSNPVYTAPKSWDFAGKLAKVPVKISFADRADETAAVCDWILPDSHYLESWNDHNPRKGHYSLQQPTIRPLFKTRQAQDTLLKWSGSTKNFYETIQENWQLNRYRSTSWSFVQFWNQSVHDGVYEENPGAAMMMPAAADSVKTDNAKAATGTPLVMMTVEPAAGTMPAPAANGISLEQARTQIGAIKGGAWEAVIYASTAMGNGVQANNPWLQEYPDPITKITWDNVITMHPMDVKEKKFFGVLEGEGEDLMVRFDQMEDQLSVATVKANGYEFKLPVWAQPGQARGTVGIALGYGRIDSFGPTSKGVGANAYPALGMTAGNTIGYEIYNAEIAGTEEKHWIATTQSHGTLMGRNEDILREVPLAEYVEKKGQVSEPMTMHTYKGHDTPTESVNLWDDHDRLNHQWGMAIDLNACNGCGACIISCNAENNVHVVGKDEVRRSREMHWMRIDRYYSSDTSKADSDKFGTKELYRNMENPQFDNPKVVFQPMLCQHCNHAPCETVCPVLATNHSSEGLNQMTYNRCVGTRYCANNCPYKVRRFNWFNYEKYHRSSDVNQNPDFNQNPAADEYGRMVLNPDVVVRSRGVMEKCSFCVQRIQAEKLEAKKRGATVADGAIKTACSQSCPTQAIIFGDLNDPNSAVAQWEKDGRKFEVLEVVGTRPSVFYMTKVWNRTETAAAPKKEAHAEEKEKAH